MKKKIAGVAVVGIVALILAAVIGRLATKTPAPVALPVPNGYDDFMAAARMIEKPPGKVESMTRFELEEMVKGEAEPLKLIHAGLLKSCRVTTTNSMEYIEAHHRELSSAVALARLLAAEARLAEMNSLPAEAAAAYVNVIRYGQQLSHGGVMIDRLSGIACEKIGVGGLFGIHQKLGSADCARLIKMLEEIDGAAESPKATLDREHAWSAAVGGWQGGMIRLIKPNLTAAAEAKYLKGDQDAELQRRRIMIDLAARAYEADHQKRPAGFSDLVPRYLPKIPNDSTTGAAVTYAWH